MEAKGHFMSGEVGHSMDCAGGKEATRDSTVGICALAVRREETPPVATSHAEKPLDREQLIRRCLGRIELAERLLASFDSRFPDELSQIEACLQKDDPVQLARLVHQLKGAAANVSAPELHARLANVELAVRAEQSDAACVCLEEVHQAWDRYREFRSKSNPSSNS